MSEIAAILPTSATMTTSQHLGDAFSPNPTPTPPHDPPPPPHPSSDPRLTAISNDDNHTAKQQAAAAENDEDDSIVKKSDLFKLKPLEALQLLSASVEFLVRITGDVPPTPPPKTPTNPQMSNMQVEKENIARSYSEKSLAKLRAKALQEEEEKRKQKEKEEAEREEEEKRKQKEKKEAEEHRREKNAINREMGLSPVSISSSTTASIDGVRLKHEPNQFQDPMAGNFQPPPDQHIIWGSDSLNIALQHGAITRKFYSKNEPPIPLNQYLLRLHQFCPMSTAVYLATSLYIHRLAVEERAIPVTRRNVHRLVLAGLRVAMKALEDLSYPHSKIAKVGGVSEIELVRLEINFCFLAGFELVVGEETLRKHWEMLRSGGVQRIVDEMETSAVMPEKKSRATFSY